MQACRIDRGSEAAVPVLYWPFSTGPPTTPPLRVRCTRSIDGRPPEDRRRGHTTAKSPCAAAAARAQLPPPQRQGDNSGDAVIRVVWAIRRAMECARHVWEALDDRLPREAAVSALGGVHGRQHAQLAMEPPPSPPSLNRP